MTNADYGIRPVKWREISDACGSSARALAITGGLPKVALFYLNNLDKIESAAEIDEADTELARDLCREAKYHARVIEAAEAYNLAGTLASIQATVKCGHPMARNLLESAHSRGLIRDKPRADKCATPTATNP